MLRIAGGARGALNDDDLAVRAGARWRAHHELASVVTRVDHLQRDTVELSLHRRCRA